MGRWEGFSRRDYDRCSSPVDGPLTLYLLCSDPVFVQSHASIANEQIRAPAVHEGEVGLIQIFRCPND